MYTDAVACLPFEVRRLRKKVDMVRALGKDGLNQDVQMRGGLNVNLFSFKSIARDVQKGSMGGM